MSNSYLFGTSGIRGDATKLFTNQFCFDIGRTFAKFLEKNSLQKVIAVGSDPRESSPRIKSAIVSGLLYENSEVYDEGVVPIPAMNYLLIANPRYKGSLMVTGSHIKSYLNGVKFFVLKEEILKDQEKEIVSIYNTLKEDVFYKNIENNIFIETEAGEKYKEYLRVSKKGNYPKWKILVDPGNGAQSEIVPEVLSEFGLNVIKINCEIQKEILSRDTEVESEFTELKTKTKDTRADFAIAFDSDGDRVIFIDHDGNYISGDYIGALVSKHTNCSAIATPINTSQVIDKIGKRVIRTKVGSPHVVQAIKENNLDYGFEANGGGIFKNMLSRDGGRTAIELLNILAREKKTLSNLVGELPKYYLYRDKVEYRWELKDTIMEKVRKHFKAVKTEELDGVKIWTDNESWILFRSSSNAPEFRVFAESSDNNKANELISKGLSLVREIVNNYDNKS